MQGSAARVRSKGSASARIMTAFIPMVEQSAILDRIGASANGFVLLERICGQKERDESVGRIGDNSEEDADSCFVSNANV